VTELGPDWVPRRRRSAALTSRESPDVSEVKLVRDETYRPSPPIRFHFAGTTSPAFVMLTTGRLSTGEKNPPTAYLSMIE